MKIATQTDALSRRLGDKKAVEIICRAGFSGIDYSMFPMNDPKCPLLGDEMPALVDSLKEIAKRYDAVFTQAHAPFPTMRKEDEDYNKFVFKAIVRSIEIAGRLGVKNIVVHPISFVANRTDFDLNYSFYQRLVPYIDEYGVRVCTENMWGHENGKFVCTACSSPSDFRQMTELLGSERFGACLDIGHCGLVGFKPSELIRAIGKEYLCALHIHDNDHTSDAHIFPFNGKIDWADTMSALHEIDYQGDLTFEADNSLVSCPDSFLQTAECHLHDIGLALLNMMN
ncbi:MAG TPA: hypothetical protein DDY98_00445 [Ruminococcaceae bacterium]|nr:hypothetical protein [Oscillospiraceae bacterium]